MHKVAKINPTMLLEFIKEVATEADEQKKNIAKVRVYDSMVRKRREGERRFQQSFKFSKSEVQLNSLHICCSVYL